MQGSELFAHKCRMQTFGMHRSVCFSRAPTPRRGVTSILPTISVSLQGLWGEISVPVHQGLCGCGGYRGDLGAGAAVALSRAAAATEWGNHGNSITASILLLLTRLSSSSASPGAAAAAAAAAVLAGARAQQPRLQPAACPSPTCTVTPAPHRHRPRGGEK